MINKELEFQLKHWIESWKRYGPRVWLWLADCFKIHNMQSLSFTLFEVTNYDTHHCYRCVFSALKAPISEEEERKRPFCCVAMNNLPQFADFPVDGVAKYSIIVDGLTGRVIILKVRVRSILEFAFVNFLMLLVWIFHMHFTVLKSDVIYISPYSSYQVFYVILYLYLRQPLDQGWRSEGLSAFVTYEIHFCTDQAKTHREVRFWFDLSYDATRVHRQMLRITFCCFLFVFCWKVLPWDLNCLQNGRTRNMCHLMYGVLWHRHYMRT